MVSEHTLYSSITDVPFLLFNLYLYYNLAVFIQAALEHVVQLHSAPLHDPFGNFVRGVDGKHGGRLKPLHTLRVEVRPKATNDL